MNSSSVNRETLVGVATAADFERKVLAVSAERPVLVDFWAAWCGPCKALGPILEDVARAREGKADVVKVDTDTESELAVRFNIRALPTLLVFRDGAVAEQLVGLRAASDLVAAIDRAAVKAA